MSSSVSETRPYHHNRNHCKLSCWRDRTSLERKLIVLTSCLAILSVILLMTLVVKNFIISGSDPATTRSQSSRDCLAWKICTEEHCRRAGQYFSLNMNMAADPCSDFHEFVCGNWAKRYPIPEDQASYGVMNYVKDEMTSRCIDLLSTRNVPEASSKAIDKSKAFFQSCIKTENVDAGEGADQLRTLLEDVGVATNMAADGSQVAVDFSWTKTLSRIVRNYGSNFIIKFDIDPDVKNTSRNIITVDQPGAFGTGRNTLLGKSEPRMVAYKKYIKDSLCLLDQGNCSNMTRVAQDIAEFEVAMTKVTTPKTKRRKASSWYFPMTLRDLQLKVPEIPFLEYIADILNGTGQFASEDTVVIVKGENYFKSLVKLIRNTKPSVVSNYLGWRLLQTLGPALFNAVREVKFEFDKVNSGVQKEADIGDSCFDLTNRYLGQAVGNLYVRETGLDTAAKTDVEDMVGHLMKAFGTLLDRNDWMDNATVTTAKYKLSKMAAMIGYPDWTMIPTELNKYFEDLPPLNRSNFFENYRSVMMFRTGKIIEKLSKVNNRTADWNKPASTVDAFHNPSYNRITFPAGILQLPFYGKQLKVLNYGAIGYAIGHEITHGFDDRGRQYDGEGSLRDWWTPDTLAKFTERKNCFVDQYSNVTDLQSGLNLNGAQTIGEDIADNGGIREAYKAYQLSGRESDRLPGLEKFDDTQLFFISAASVWCTQFRKEAMVNFIYQDVHSPGKYRVNIPFANMKEFAVAFKCPPGSKMNPEKRCAIW